jgi:hypothetical protein
VHEYTFDDKRVVDTDTPATFLPPITKPGSDAEYDIPIGWSKVSDIKKRVQLRKEVSKGRTQKDSGQATIYASHQVTHDSGTQAGGTAVPDSQGSESHLNGNYLSVYLDRESAEELVEELAFLPRAVGMRPRTKGAAGQACCPMQLFMSVTATRCVG